MFIHDLSSHIESLVFWYLLNELKLQWEISLQAPAPYDGWSAASKDYNFCYDCKNNSTELLQKYHILNTSLWASELINKELAYTR